MSTGTGCLEMLWSFLWRYSRAAWKLSYATYCKEPAFRVGFDDPHEDSFNTYNSVILQFCENEQKKLDD